MLMYSIEIDKISLPNTLKYFKIFLCSNNNIILDVKSSHLPLQIFSLFNFSSSSSQTVECRATQTQYMDFHHLYSPLLSSPLIALDKSASQRNISLKINKKIIHIIYRYFDLLFSVSSQKLGLVLEERPLFRGLKSIQTRKQIQF